MILILIIFIILAMPAIILTIWNGACEYLVFLVFCIFTFIPVATVEPQSQKEWMVTDRKDLISVRTDKQLEGSFFLGCGKIDGEDYLIYFIKDDDGYLIRKKFPMNKVRIKEDNSQIPHYESEQIYLHKSWKNIGRWLDDKRLNIIVPEETVIIKWEIE